MWSGLLQAVQLGLTVSDAIARESSKRQERLTESLGNGLEGVQDATVTEKRPEAMRFKRRVLIYGYGGILQTSKIKHAPTAALRTQITPSIPWPNCMAPITIYRNYSNRSVLMIEAADQLQMPTPESPRNQLALPPSGKPP